MHDQPFIESWTQVRVLEIEHYIQEKYTNSFKLGKCLIDFSSKRRSSRGGLYTVKSIKVPGINLALYNDYHLQGKISIFSEYSSYNNDKIIGGFVTKNYLHRIGAITCHEMAHAIQRWLEYYKSLPRSMHHGKEFKHYYADLRNKFVNPYLPSIEEQKRLYKEFLNAS